MSATPRNSPLIPVRSENLREAWDARCGSRATIFGDPECIRIDEGGEWGNGNLTDNSLQSRIKIQFQGAGAHH